MNIKRLLSVILSVVLLCACIPMISAELNNTNPINTLKVNNQTEPLGIDDASPKFSWISELDGYQKAQSAYRITVSSSDGNTGDMWDSGKINGVNNYDIIYDGAPLSSKTKYFWRVQVFDENDTEIGWSDTVSFETGIFTDIEWGAQWITHLTSSPAINPAPMFRKEFNITGEVEKARVYVSGLGIYELKINGLLPDDTVLNLGNTKFDVTVPYAVYDVTELLGYGQNAIGIELGNGFYNEDGGWWGFDYAAWRSNPKFILRMDITYTNDSVQTVVSDTTWSSTNTGPVTFDSIYYGETYDARNEKTGFSEAGYIEDVSWSSALLAAAPAGELKHSYIEPMRRTKTFKPKQINKLSEGSYIIQNPEMTTGWMKLKIKAPTGSEITIKYGEKLKSDGSLTLIGGTDNTFVADNFPKRGAVLQNDIYTAKGTPDEFFEPRFSYKGYEFIQVDGYVGDLTSDDVELYRINNDVEKTAELSTSNDLINTLHSMMQNTLLNNYQGKPTDTPVFEKLGWTEIGRAHV